MWKYVGRDNGFFFFIIIIIRNLVLLGKFYDQLYDCVLYGLTEYYVIHQNTTV